MDKIHIKICVEHHKMQKNTNNANKTRVLLQTTGGKDEPNIVSMRKPQRTLQHGTQNVKTHNRSKQKLISILTWCATFALKTIDVSK